MLGSRSDGAGIGGGRDGGRIFSAVVRVRRGRWYADEARGDARTASGIRGGIVKLPVRRSDVIEVEGGVVL